MLSHCGTIFELRRKQKILQNIHAALCQKSHYDFCDWPIFYNKEVKFCIKIYIRDYVNQMSKVWQKLKGGGGEPVSAISI